jgi:hypothetical protein
MKQYRLVHYPAQDARWTPGERSWSIEYRSAWTFWLWMPYYGTSGGTSKENCLEVLAWLRRVDAAEQEPKTVEYL